jgi:hypothetical protein
MVFVLSTLILIYRGPQNAPDRDIERFRKDLVRLHLGRVFFYRKKEGRLF